MAKANIWIAATKIPSYCHSWNIHIYDIYIQLLFCLFQQTFHYPNERWGTALNQPQKKVFNNNRFHGTGKKTHKIRITTKTNGVCCKITHKHHTSSRTIFSHFLSSCEYIFSAICQMCHIRIANNNMCYFRNGLL